jgi:hypothetical protein
MMRGTIRFCPGGQFVGSNHGALDGCSGDNNNEEAGMQGTFFFNSDVASYVGPIQTDFLMTVQKSYGGTGIVIPVKKMPQEWKKQESGGLLQELPT